MAVSTPQAQHREKYYDAAQISASLADGWASLKKAQRALERAKRVAGKYASSENESEREQAAKVITITDSVDLALSLLEQE